MKKALIFVLAVIILIIIIFMLNYFWPRKQNSPDTQSSAVKYSQIEINGQTIKVEVADNDELRTKGLSGRDNLAENEGMLFVFEKSGIYPFWMRNMKFAIDIIWIKDKKIVEIVKNAEPPTVAGKTLSYTPKADANMVLEVNSGFCDKFEIKVEGEIVIK